MVNKVRANTRRPWRLDARLQCFVDAKAFLLEYSCRDGGRFLIGPLLQASSMSGSQLSLLPVVFLGAALSVPPHRQSAKERRRGRLMRISFSGVYPSRVER